MKRKIKNPAYPLPLNLILDDVQNQREYVESVSTDELDFDRGLPFPRLGQDVGYRTRRWVVTNPARKQPGSTGGPELEWVQLTEQA
jgi:hypothetical protein